MKIDTISELEALLDLCHRKSVFAIEVDGVKLNINLAAPQEVHGSTADEAEHTDDEELFWSSGGSN